MKFQVTNPRAPLIPKMPQYNEHYILLASCIVALAPLHTTAALSATCAPYLLFPDHMLFNESVMLLLISQQFLVLLSISVLLNVNMIVHTVLC